MKRAILYLLSMILIFQCFGLCTAAADVNGIVKYDPVDIVVVIDKSGSMNYSDSTHMVPPAVNMLVDMVPAEETRVGVVTFNTKATSLTTDINGNPALLTLKEFDNVKDIKESVSAVKYQGDTGIGNALKLATDMLAAASSDGRQKAIILFTDGVDDFGIDQLGLAQCKENQSSAVQWAIDNDCAIYCIGYNYHNSMGPNAEGITKLESISKPTGGVAKAITSIDQVESMFITMIAELFDLIYVPVDTVPGDGQRHEVLISVGPEVVEANVRITCNTKGALAAGTIELYNPNGEKVALQNGGKVRYALEDTSASIKVISPASGIWKLVLDGIRGEEVKVGLLAHYKLGISATLTLPEGNPDATAYVGDAIGVSAYLTNDGTPVTDSAVYDSVTVARVTVTPRANPDNSVAYALTYDGTQYVGSFEIDEISAYDIIVEIGSDTFTRIAALELQSNNHPLVLEKEFEDVKLNKNKQIEITDIYTYVSDPEDDAITAEITNNSEPDLAAVQIQNDKIIIDGTGWGGTNITVTFTDAHGNTVSSTFKASVNDPVAWAIIITILVLIIILVLLILYWLYKKSLSIVGKIRITGIHEGIIESSGRKPAIMRTLYSNTFTESNPGTFAGGIGTPVGGAGGPFGGSTGGPFGGSTGGPFGGSTGGPFGGSTGGAFGGAFEENNNVAFTEEEEQASKAYSEDVKLSKLGKKPSLATAICKFMNNYHDYLVMKCPGGKKAAAVKECAGFISNAFGGVLITGTPKGSLGINLKFPKDTSIISYGSEILNRKIVTNIKRNESLKMEFAVPDGTVHEGKQGCIYITFVYTNAK